MEQKLLAVTKTTITDVRLKQETWILETMAAIKFEFSRKWSITPEKDMPVELFFGKGGRLHFIHIASRLLNCSGQTMEGEEKLKN